MVLVSLGIWGKGQVVTALNSWKTDLFTGKIKWKIFSINVYMRDQLRCISNFSNFQHIRSINAYMTDQ
jgi:hypothetical protein